MVRRLLLNVSSLILLFVLLIACILPVMAFASAAYPPMAPGESTGSVTGRVTTNASHAMPGIPVYIVNAADSSMRYYSSTTDGSGYFTIAGVNATNGSAVYRILAASPGYDDATSSAFSVSSNTTASVYVMMTRNYSIATPTPTPAPKPGDITGRITIENTTTGVVNAQISLVKADCKYVALTRAVTDSSGRYRFSGVDYLDAPGYMVRVEKDGYEEKFSEPFLIVSESEVTRDLSLSPANKTTTSQAATVTPVPAGPTAKPSATAAPQANASLPGFSLVSALAGVAAAYAVARKN